MLERQDIGTVESLRIDVLSETGWFDDGRFKADMAAGGGSEQSQSRSPGTRRTPAATRRC